MTTKFKIPHDLIKEVELKNLQESVKQSKEDPICTTINLFENTWPNSHRAVPNTALRSSLFGIARKGSAYRTYIDKVEIASWKGTSIKYTGVQLNQSDLDIWLACIEICKEKSSLEITVHQREFMRICGQKVTNPKWLINTLERLTCAHLNITNKKFTFVGSILLSASKEHETGSIILKIAPEMIALFSSDVTYLDIEKRHQLKTQLSKWLHCFVSSHQSDWRNPSFIAMDNLQKLCGSSTSKRDFKYKVSKSMTDLKNKHIIAGSKIENNILTFWHFGIAKITATKAYHNSDKSVS